ncbi:TRAP transporter large permease [Terribacillus saccharophilus]|uniref:C4-dicarboxylate ABC transporter permease n=1 Tax=Terribacillus saccharophilus TaxID=361277 RepID=A0ABX4H071_9BACI|nr:TRAP transporter large permease [Terribacillus saccharophilus]PAD36000.1 C4-dicarboxylate ABC transporter permease [Terribacillus saccharophilus]PAD96949.1 C4-dicarboxylate ABC transporter permease [Terribacillus saccharophilus]PAE00525.1 C4-dicarboxylate ABC transporter permease [Terribacillus saccharophilus]
MSAIIMFGSFGLLLLVSVPIGIALALSSIATLLFAQDMSLSFLAQGLITSVDSFPIMAVPFFILAGEIMGKGGLSKRLIKVAESVVGNVAGGFAMTTIITCLFFAAISGSGPATVAAVGGIMIPAMVQIGYSKQFAAGIVAAAGTLGVILPPSIPMIVYGVASGTSVGDLFIAGVLPSILIAALLMVYVYFYAKKKGYSGTGEAFSLKRVIRAFWDAKWALLVPVIILGGIYGGFFTPTEAAVVAVVYGLIAGVFLYKELRLKDLYEVFRNAALTTATIMLIIGAATAFGKIMIIEQMPSRIANGMLSISDNPVILMSLIVIMLLFIGMVMDTTAAIIIFTPLLIPVGVELGFDPVHYGMIIILTLVIGFITPPIGVNLFVASEISSLPIMKISKAIVPYIAVMLVALILVILIPEIALLLLGGK